MLSCIVLFPLHEGHRISSVYVNQQQKQHGHSQPSSRGLCKRHCWFIGSQLLSLCPHTAQLTHWFPSAAAIGCRHALPPPPLHCPPLLLCCLGTLAGSSILLLSLAWGVSVLIGRCDLNEAGVAVDRKHTRGWDLRRTGWAGGGGEEGQREGAGPEAAPAGLLYGQVCVVGPPPCANARQVLKHVTVDMYVGLACCCHWPHHC